MILRFWKLGVAMAVQLYLYYVGEMESSYTPVIVVTSNEAPERAKEIVLLIPFLLGIGFTLSFVISTSGFPAWLAYNPLGFPEDDGGCGNTDETESCIGGVDFVTLIFTLSALPLDRMPKAFKECFAVLSFRDYGVYDMTMLRFDPPQRIGYREYLRSDGRGSYFFCLDTVRSLTSAAGFTEVELEYCCVKSVNRLNRKTMKRVWVHGKFQKPS